MTARVGRVLRELKVWHPGLEAYRYHRFNPLTHRHEMREMGASWRSINTDRIDWFCAAELKALGETMAKPYG